MIQEGGAFHFFDDLGNLRVKITTDPTRDYSPVGEWYEFDLKGEICKTYSFSTRKKMVVTSKYVAKSLHQSIQKLK